MNFEAPSRRNGSITAPFLNQALLQPFDLQGRMQTILSQKSQQGSSYFSFPSQPFTPAQIPHTIMPSYDTTPKVSLPLCLPLSSNLPAPAFDSAPSREMVSIESLKCQMAEIERGLSESVAQLDAQRGSHAEEVCRLNAEKETLRVALSKLQEALNVSELNFMSAKKELNITLSELCDSRAELTSTQSRLSETVARYGGLMSSSSVSQKAIIDLKAKLLISDKAAESARAQLAEAKISLAEKCRKIQQTERALLMSKKEHRHDIDESVKLRIEVKSENDRLRSELKARQADLRAAKVKAKLFVCRGHRFSAESEIVSKKDKSSETDELVECRLSMMPLSESVGSFSPIHLVSVGTGITPRQPNDDKFGKENQVNEFSPVSASQRLAALSSPVLRRHPSLVPSSAPSPLVPIQAPRAPKQKNWADRVGCFGI